MGRPPLPLGTHGRVKVYAMSGGQFRARCRYRDFDGRTYEVERYAVSRARAEARLMESLRDWSAPGSGGVTADDRFRTVAARWLQDLVADAERGHASFGTVDTYRSRLDRVVLPAVGDLRMRELSVAVLDGLCRRVRDNSSASSARTVRAVLSGVCGFAVRHGALTANLVREVGRLDNRRARHRAAASRALTVEQVLDLLAKLDGDEEAQRHDLPDLVRFLLATGERTGEALAARWVDFDEAAGVIEVAGNVVRAKGRGVVRNAGKTRTAVRPIALPQWAVSMLAQRRAASGDPDGLIFPSTTGTVREASNVRSRAWRPFALRAGYDWVVFRTFRKTVATLLDDADLTARQIADVLGHASPSMTQDVYMGRGVVNRNSAAALESLRSE